MKLLLPVAGARAQEMQRCSVGPERSGSAPTSVARTAGVLDRRTTVTATQADGPHGGSADAWINAIQVYRFPLALAVVAVHSGEFVMRQSTAALSGGAGAGPGLWMVEFLTMACRLATPSFLVIAGFLFFRNGPVSFGEYRRKLHSRVYTLLLPYVAWNLIAMLWLCAPATGKHFFFEPGSCACSTWSFSSIVRWFAGWPVYPADAPLWFVRDMVLLVLAAPLLNLIPKRVLPLALGALALYYLAGPIDLVPGGIPRASSVFFFLAGAWMGINRISLCESPALNRIILLAAAVFVSAAALGASLPPPAPGHFEAQALTERIVRVSGALLVICAAMKPVSLTPCSRLLLRLSPASFFLFAFHYCVFACPSALFGYFPRGCFGIGHDLTLFIAVFAGAVAASLGSYFLLKRYAPSLLLLLDGNRSAPALEDRPNERMGPVAPLRDTSFALR